MLRKKRLEKWRNSVTRSWMEFNHSGSGDVAMKARIIDEFKNWYTEYTLLLNELSKKPIAARNYSTQTIKQLPSHGQFSDQNADSIVNRFIDYFQDSFKTQSGGALTYILGDESIHKPFMGNPFPAEGIPDKDNVLIMGGGPNGLYMASILKAAMPDLIVNVIETRVDDTGARFLRRTGRIQLPSGIMFDRTKDFKQIINSVAPGIHDVVYIKSYLMWFNGLLRDINNVRVNQVELHYAVLAQSLGVNIFHDKHIELGKYVNSKTLCLFDATGGKFRPLQHIWDNFVVIDDATSRKNATSDKWKDLTGELHYKESTGTHKPFNIYEGFLPPELSVNKEHGIPYVAIGDTTIRTNYKKGKGLYFNFLLSTLYAILLAKIRNIPIPENRTADSKLIRDSLEAAAAAVYRADVTKENARLAPVGGAGGRGAIRERRSVRQRTNRKRGTRRRMSK